MKTSNIKKNLLNGVAVIVIGVILGLGIQFVSAAGWIPAPAPPPSGSIPGPITTGVGDQTKEGGHLTLASGGLAAKYNLLTEGTVYADSSVETKELCLNPDLPLITSPNRKCITDWPATVTPPDYLRNRSSCVTPLTVGKRYLVTVYGVVCDHGSGTGIYKLGAVALATNTDGTGGTDVTGGSVEINWPDGCFTQSATFITNPVTSTILCGFVHFGEAVDSKYDAYNHSIPATSMTAMEIK